jgi:hypothetical protein
MQVATQAGNAEPLIPGSPVQDLVARQTASFGDMADRLLWPAMLRKLDRIDTGYRE